jgi:hypothetical protein
MTYGTIGWMKVLAIKGIEKYGNQWGVRYTRHHGRNVQDAVFLCNTPEEAQTKYRELLDVLLNHHGVYIGSKERRKLKANRSKVAEKHMKKQQEAPSTRQFVPYKSRNNSSEHAKEYTKQYYIRKQLGEI